jgi:hypothetical protein
MCGLRTCPGLWRSFHIPTPAFCRLCMYTCECVRKSLFLSLFFCLFLFRFARAPRGGVIPDRALCLPTLSHFLIVNKHTLGTSQTVSSSQKPWTYFAERKKEKEKTRGHTLGTSASSLHKPLRTHFADFSMLHKRSLTHLAEVQQKKSQCPNIYR